MSQKKRGLGKGLSDLGLTELLGDMQAPPTTVSENISSDSSLDLLGDVPPTDSQLKKLPIDVVKPGRYQPRQTMSQEGLEELANSIRKQGVIQPIIVRMAENHQYEIIAGERRWRAAQLAGLDYIPAIVREVNDEAAIAMALIENIQRRDLNAIEEAVALQRLINEFQMTHQAVADAVGKSRVNVTNLLRLLKLNHDVQSLLEKGHLEMGHARALLTLESHQQNEIANVVVARALSVRQTEDLIRQMSQEKNPSASSDTPEKVVLHTLQERLSEKLGASVAVSQNARGKGKLIIKFNSDDELQGILAHIQ